MSNPSEKGKKSLEMRISDIENKLSEIAGMGGIGQVKASEEDVETYKKVLRTALDDDSACGINECSKCIVTVCDRCINVCRVCDRCINVCRVCDRCINVCRVCDRCYECSCGPCGIDVSSAEDILGRTEPGRIRRRARDFETLG